MNYQPEIHTAFINYLDAFYSQKFDKVYDLLYDEDVEKFYQKTMEIAERMDEFGEADLFLTKFKLKTVSELKALSVKEFTISILKIAKIEIGEKELNKILKETKITGVEEATFVSIVSYEYPLKLYDKWQIIRNNVEMIQSKGKWKLLFKSGMEAGFSRFHDEIDSFHQRKLKDNLSNFKFEDDLIKFTITGYKDFSTGKIVFEPRFKDAGDFSDGLAPVQIIKKYGYINLKGEIAIKPQFIFAGEFSENLAAVKIALDDTSEKWGFINKKGQLIIEPAFENTRNFKDNLCAVEIDKKWGYINKKGQVVIPCKFDQADDFSYGTASVEIYNESGESTSFVINKKGKIEEMY